SEHGAGVPSIVGDEPARADLGIGVTGVVLDELDRRHARLDRRRDIVARVGLVAGWKVGAEPHRYLALDGDAAVIAVAQRRRRAMDHPGEYGASDRLVDCHELLHHRRGDGDLVTDDLAALWDKELLERLLDGIGLFDTGVADLGRRRRQRLP